MASLVPKTPSLPLATGQSDPGSLQRFQSNLIKQLIVILTEYARRLNLAFMGDGTERMIAPLPLDSSTVVGLSAFPAANWEGGLLYISNETGGKTVAFSDGVNWRRAQDRVIVS